jgi:DUF4097 and DUF4098 domain-containing protein YvlB
MRLLRPAAPALFALSIAASAACSIELDAAQYIGKEDKSFAVSGAADVTIKTFDGSIQVTAWDKPEVAVTIERRADNQADADALKVKAEQTGGKVVIEALKPESEIHVGWTHGRSVSFVVHVPKQTNLSAKSGDGSIQASGVSGTVDLASGDGSIKASDLTGQVGLHTGDGSISAQNVTGTLSIATGDGSITVQGAPRALKAHTGDGSVHVAVASTTSPEEDWEITTGDGSVAVELPQGFNAMVDAHTGDGTVNADDFGLKAHGDDKNDLQGTLGSGGRTLRIRSGDGSISIARH